jgi:hypothetical protein
MKVSHDLNLSELFPDIQLPKKGRKEAEDLIADLIREEILSHVADQNSPVAGHGKFPKLNKEYKEKKKGEGLPGLPNLEFSGDMLDALEVYPVRGGVIRVEISGEEAPKADGHNNHSGDSTLPLRRFIPDDGETFKKKILSGVRDILLEYSDD